MKLDWNRLPPGLRNREAKRIAAATGIGLLIATAYVLLAPNWYESTLTVVPSGSSKGAALGGQIVGALGGIELPGDLSGNADIERIAAVLESRSVTDAIIKRFDLTIRYGEKYVEQARKRLWSHCSTRIDRKAKLVWLSCEDKDPRFVQGMLEYFGEYGNAVFRRVSTSSANEEVKFLDRRVAEMRKEADEAANRLREFEEKYKIIDLESQSKAVVSAMASLRSQEIAKELQLSYMNTFSARDESSAMQLRQQLAVMNSKFKKLEQETSVESVTSSVSALVESKAANAKGADIFPAAMNVPRLRFELEQLIRDRKIRETDLMLLMQRLEMAKVNEARDTSAFQILDHPVVPTYRSRPKRLLALAVGIFAGFLLGVAWMFGPALLRNLNLAADGRPQISKVRSIQ